MTLQKVISSLRWNKTSTRLEKKKQQQEMASWEDIINNRLMMGQARWITYANNARRREEEEEQRPGTRPSAGREGRPEPPRFLHWEPLREENFQRNPIRAQNRPEFVPQSFIQIQNPCPT